MISQFRQGEVIQTNCFCSLKECSRDKDECMIEIDSSVVNFDKLKREFCNKYLNSSENAMKSVDCYLELNSGDIYLIEFKNGHVSKNEALGLKLKLKDSLLLINESFGKNLKLCKTTITYVVVYNRDKNPSTNNTFKKTLLKRSSLNHIIKFKLDDFRDILKDVKTLDSCEFKNFWKTQIQPNLRNNQEYIY